MRPKERIPIFLQNINWNTLAERWEIDVELFNRIRSMRGPVRPKIRHYWEEQPDLRFGQMLINLGVVPDDLKIWNDEEHDILHNQGIPLREILLWGNNYDKDMCRLPKTIWNPICDMKSDHIKAILDGDWCKNPLYLETFKEELKLRGIK